MVVRFSLFRLNTSLSEGVLPKHPLPKLAITIPYHNEFLILVNLGSSQYNRVQRWIHQIIDLNVVDMSVIQYLQLELNLSKIENWLEHACFCKLLISPPKWGQPTLTLSRGGIFKVVGSHGFFNFITNPIHILFSAVLHCINQLYSQKAKKKFLLQDSFGVKNEKQNVS